jgi:hypothetical protein
MSDSVCPRCSGVPHKRKCEFCKGTGLHPWPEGFRTADDLRAEAVQRDKYRRRLGPNEEDATPDQLAPGWLKRGLGSVPAQKPKGETMSGMRKAREVATDVITVKFGVVSGAKAVTEDRLALASWLREYMAKWWDPNSDSSMNGETMIDELEAVIRKAGEP